MSEKFPVLFSYPDSMEADLRAKGVEMWTSGGEFGSFSEAMEKAREHAERLNMPVQVSRMGMKMVVYPSSIPYGGGR